MRFESEAADPENAGLHAARTFLEPIEVTGGESLRVVMHSTREKDKQGNIDLFVRFMDKPTKWSFDCQSTRGGSTEICTTHVPWNQHVAYVGAFGYGDGDDVEITVSRVVDGTGISWQEVEMLLEKSLTLADGPETFDEVEAGSMDWGEGCEGGFADLQPTLTAGETLPVGLVPTGKLGVSMTLKTDVNASLTVFDKISGTEILGPENSLFKDTPNGCINYYGATYCVSGLSGAGGSQTFEVKGVTTRQLVVRILSEGDGDAVLDYKWEEQADCESSINESTEHTLEASDTAVVATIPEGAQNVLIAMSSTSDLDLMLFDGDKALVHWAWVDEEKGILSGAHAESADYEGLKITYSGYAGSDESPGNEFIKLFGTTAAPLEARVFGYESGVAQISVMSGLPDDQVAPEL